MDGEALQSSKCTSLKIDSNSNNYVQVLNISFKVIFRF